MNKTVFKPNIGDPFNIQAKLVNTDDTLMISVPQDANIEFLRNAIRDQLKDDPFYNQHRDYKIQLSLQLPDCNKNECHLFNSSYVSLVVPKNFILLVKYLDKQGNMIQKYKQGTVTSS